MTISENILSVVNEIQKVQMFQVFLISLVSGCICGIAFILGIR